jgi:ferric-dicitrate binding protein FerR (iron transport regulator)
MPTSRIVYLLQQYLDKRITKEELVELNSLLEDESTEESMQQAMESILRAEVAAVEPRGRVYSMRRVVWVAAAVLLLAVAGLWLMHSGGKKKEPAVVAVAHDAAPGSNKALLTLGNGDTIHLDEARAGLVGQQGKTRLIKSVDAQLRYEGAGDEDNIQYNLLVTPRGGQYKLVLPDGTKVWLNAATALRYPTAFMGKDRVVELDGEAYFEVATDAARPFRVDVKNGGRVDVLGTHFNIMSYADEPVARTTLLEGAVRVSKGDKNAVMRPGQQARVGKDGSLVVVSADVDEAMAWKNGLFKFEEADIEQVMRQLSRWYDLQVVYTQGVPKDRFQGEMYRDVNLSKIVKILEASGVHFRIEGKKLLVQ